MKEAKGSKDRKDLLQVRISEELKAGLSIVSSLTNRSMTDIIEDSLKEYMETLPQDLKKIIKEARTFQSGGKEKPTTIPKPLSKLVSKPSNTSKPATNTTTPSIKPQEPTGR